MRNAFRYLLAMVLGAVLSTFVLHYAQRAYDAVHAAHQQAYLSYAWFGSSTMLRGADGQPLNRAAVLERLIDEYVARQVGDEVPSN